MPKHVVYHGTSHAFKIEIEDHGLRARPGLSRGPRVVLNRDLALIHATAWCAFIMLHEQLPPKALIAKATLDQRDIREGSERNPLADMTGLSEMFPGEARAGHLKEAIEAPALVVPAGIASRAITLEEIELPFLYQPIAAKRALEVWERLTDRKITIR